LVQGHEGFAQVVRLGHRGTPSGPRTRCEITHPAIDKHAPISDEDNPYVPVNGPAISDLFGMFEFRHDHDHRNHD
jgi:phospholipase C